MRGIRCRGFPGIVAAVGALVAMASGGLAGEDPRPSAPATPASDAPVNIFVNGPGVARRILKSLKEPDFVILRGEEYRRLRKPSAIPNSTANGATLVAVGVTGAPGRPR